MPNSSIHTRLGKQFAYRSAGPSLGRTFRNATAASAAFFSIAKRTWHGRSEAKAKRSLPINPGRAMWLCSADSPPQASKRVGSALLLKMRIPQLPHIKRTFRRKVPALKKAVPKDLAQIRDRLEDRGDHQVGHGADEAGHDDQNRRHDQCHDALKVLVEFLVVAFGRAAQ